MTALEARAGKNASLKPHPFANVAYGTNESYRISQLGGLQLLIAGPPAPGSGGKNSPPRAQDTEGQFDLGVERYMGARSRLLQPQTDVLGVLYGIDMVGAAAVTGSVVLVRPNGKAIVIATMTVVAGASAVTTGGLLPPGYCLAPGEDIVFIPLTTGMGSQATEGHALFVPAFVDCDLISQRIPLTTANQSLLVPPPGKVWQLATSDTEGQYDMGILNLDTGVNHDYQAFINDGVGDVLFDDSVAVSGTFKALSAGNGFFLPAGHTLKAKLDVNGPDVLFYATVAEYNEAEVGDTQFATPTVVLQGTPPG